MSVAITAVTNRRLRRQFLDLPGTLIYRHNASWIPRIRSSEQELVGFRHHPFYDEAKSLALVATVSGKPRGRIVAIDNSAHQQQYADDLGFVGFFESVDDQQVADALFAAAADWLRQRGKRHMRGPVSPSMNYEAGLLIRGFDMPPTFMMPYNGPEYAPLWERAGFEKVQDLFAFQAHKDMLATMNEKVRRVYQGTEQRLGAVFRKVDRKRFREDVQTFLGIYNQASANTWGFVPLSAGEIKQLSGELRHLIIPELTAIATIEGKVVGAAFGMLDYNPLVKRIRGRLFPFGFLQLLTGRRHLKKCRLMSANVVPEYQRWGVGIALMGLLAQQGLAWGLEEVEFSYVLESNHLARSSLENGGANCQRTYRVYEKEI